MTSRQEARSARKADGDGHEGRCTKGFDAGAGAGGDVP